MIPRFKPWLGWPEFRALFRKNTGAVKRFEQEFSNHFEAAEAVAFPYGRSALWAFLKAVGLEDVEVIMPAYTCSVVAHAITLSGNHPRFVDINLTDYNMDLDLLNNAIGPKTHAVAATHLFGYAMNLDRLEAIIHEAEQKFGHKIWLIQDCAHSFGATWEGRHVGTSGDVALYALNISKMMTSIFGGMLTFQDKALAKKIRRYRDTHFKQPSILKPILRRLYLLAIYVAFNRWIYTLTYWISEKTAFISRFTKAYHMDDKIHFPPDYLDHMLNVEAAVGLEQLKKYHTIIENRRNNALFYSEHLSPMANITFPPIKPGATYSHYVIRVTNRMASVRALSKKGIQLGELIQYSLPELLTYNTSTYQAPNALTASQYTINLPIAPTLTARQKKKVSLAMNKYYQYEHQT